MKIFSFIIVLFLTVPSLKAQVEEEIGFKYMKAEYLVETERYEDAIKALNEIIREDATYKDALILRAQSKYMMAAYRGTKMDIIDHIQENGVSARAALWLGKADFKMSNYDAALSSLLLATAKLRDADGFEYLGDIYQRNSNADEACAYYQKSSQMGSSKAAAKLRNYCGAVSTPVNRNPQKDKNDDVVVLNPENKLPTDSDIDEHDNPSDSDPIFKKKPGSDSPVVVIDEEPAYEEDNRFPPADDTPQHIEIDEDLSLTIYGQGLGKRKVLDQPNILILSDVDGIVAVDICVNERGKVESAELNMTKSTMNKEHLVSLALRKAKEFWFEKSDYAQQCGVILFDIKKM